MPKAKAATKAAKPKAARGHKLPPPLPAGEIMKDVFKHDWQIGKAVGQGGFGQIYAASNKLDRPVPDTCNHVIKIEPKSNGPLFCEMNFYQRVALPKMITTYREARRLRYLGVPEYIAVGLHTRGNVDYRFLVLPRLGSDLQALFEQRDRCFSVHTVCAIALRLLDALEFMHSNEYVHADIKASNILLGCHDGQIQPDRVYLVDYGLAFRYKVDGKHKEYKEDPKRAHDGTIEFTSRDAHRGVAPSCRGDLEILGYCLLQWLCRQLPWEHNLNNKNYVRDEKIRLMNDIPCLMMTCFPRTKYPECLEVYMSTVAALEYTEIPDYDILRDLFRQEVSASKEWSLGLITTKKSPQPKGRKRKSDVMNGDASHAATSTSDSDVSPSPVKRLYKPKAGGDMNQNNVGSAAETRSDAKASGTARTAKRLIAAKKQAVSSNHRQKAATSRANIPHVSSTTDSDVSPSPAKKPMAKKQTNSSCPLDASSSNHDTLPAESDKTKKRVAAKKVAAKSVLAKYLPSTGTKLSPRSIIPGIQRTSPRLSPRSIIPGAQRYVRPPLTSELPTPTTGGTPQNRRKVKRSTKRGVEIAVQTSPVVRS